MTAPPAPIPDHLFSDTLWLAEGVMILGKSTRGGWWTEGVSLLRENSQSSVANSPFNQRDYTATAYTNTHTWEDRMELYQIKFLSEWMEVEKRILSCHSIMQWYIWDDFLQIFILGSPYQRSNFFVFLYLPRTVVKNTDSLYVCQTCLCLDSATFYYSSVTFGILINL